MLRQTDHACKRCFSKLFGTRRGQRSLVLMEHAGIDGYCLQGSSRYYFTITKPDAIGHANQHLWTQAHTIKHKVRRKRLSAKSKRKTAKRSGTKTWRTAAPRKGSAVK